MFVAACIFNVYILMISEYSTHAQIPGKQTNTKGNKMNVPERDIEIIKKDSESLQQ